MASEGAQPITEPRLHQLIAWFDIESAALVTILLGLFQVLLSVTVIFTDQSLPKLFILPLILGITIVAGGSLTMANERNPSRLLLRGCACMNLIGLLASLHAFCIYLYSLTMIRSDSLCSYDPKHHYYPSSYHCPLERLLAFSWSVNLLLLLYDSGAVVLHCLLSVSAFKTLKTR